MAAAVSLTLALAACGSSSKTSSPGSTTPGSTTPGGSTPSVDISSFTNDFSAMAGLADLAKSGKGKIGVLLPETTTSARYTSFDAPYLKQAMEKAGLTSDDFVITNAQGSASTQKTQADAAITNGATVLLLDPIDSGVGAAIESDAKSRGVKVIDYDRLTLGGARDYYISFDNVKVGQLIGEGFVKCATDWKVTKPQVLILDGAASDNYASLFAQGYNGVLKPHFDSGEYVKVGEPGGSWEPADVQTTFTQQLTAHPNINSAVVANDANANAVISRLKTQQIKPRTFPTTGQDAQATGMQNVLTGYQCMSVYKPIYVEAQAAVAVALYLRAGQTPPSGLVNGETDDTTAKTKVASVLLTPVSVDSTNMASTVVKDNFVKASEICTTPELKTACTQAGISG
jgi:D-xylose transport system substrate-binding protein